MKDRSSNSSSIIIREFSIEDYDSLLKLWNDSNLPYKPVGRDRRDRIERELEAANAVFLVALVGDKMAGSVFGTHDGRKGWINRLAVAPEYQQQGVARMLVERVEEILLTLGIEITACLIENWNGDSMKVFEKLGYTRHSDIVYFSKRKNPDV
ncbi:MAG: GNAT family N-acetyltransferase [Candidatus Krumholzibacteriota bacterium]|nr:GNAT family N-acetyltransferase [Candidatus Krumholzibacteriota bacterium]